MMKNIISLTAAFCIAVLPLPAFSADDGPLASWSFDLAENGVISDTTGNENDLKINAAEYLVERGFEGNAVIFNAPYETNTSRRMTFMGDALAAALNKTEQFTFICMFKKLTNVNDLGEKDLLSLYFPEGKAAARIYLKDSSIGIAARADVNEPSMSTVVAHLDLSGETDWYNLAAVFDYSQKKIKLYIDGGIYLDADVPDWSTDCFNLSSGNAKNGLGCDTAIIDNASIYTRALSQEEIISLTPAVMKLDMATGLNRQGGKINAVIPTDFKTLPGINGLISVQSGDTQFLIQNGVLGKKLSTAMAKGVSVGMWVRGSLPSAQKTLFRILNSKGISALDIKLDNNSKIEYGGRTDDDETNGREPYRSSSVSVVWDENAWHHIMCTTDFENDVRKIYFDGALMLEAQAGHRKDFYSNGYAAEKSDLLGIKDMAVDGVTVFARAMEEQEVADIIKERNNVSLFAFRENGDYLLGSELSDTVTAQAVVYNNTSAAQSGVLLIAVVSKESNLIKHIEKRTVTDLQPGSQYDTDATFHNLENGDVIRCFYWDSLSGRNIISQFKEL